MKSVILVCVLALATARPDTSYTVQSVRSDDVLKILRDDRVHPGDDGSYSFDIETENGIVRSESGGKLSIEGEPIGQQGEISYPLADGQLFTLKFVANENGYQPESPFLPIAPEFPHPIPDFVLKQIEKARLEDLEGQRSAPSSQYKYESGEKK